MKTCIAILSAHLVLALLVYQTALDARTWYITEDGTGDAPDGSGNSYASGSKRHHSIVRLCEQEAK